MSLWPPRREDQAKSDASLSGASPKGRSGRQTKSGASGSEPLVASEHLPDRVGEPAGDLDLGDLGAALFSQPALGALVALGVGGAGHRLGSGSGAGAVGRCRAGGRDAEVLSAKVAGR
jgi:hypothetical protein